MERVRIENVSRENNAGSVNLTHFSLRRAGYLLSDWLVRGVLKLIVRLSNPGLLCL
jgi:hypothetical protein